MDRKKTEDTGKAAGGIELHSARMRRFVGEVPPALVRTGTAVLSVVVALFGWAVCSIHYPVSIETEGTVVSADTLAVEIPYKYLRWVVPAQAVKASFEGDDGTPRTYSVASVDSTLVLRPGGNRFTAKVGLGPDRAKVQVGQRAEVRIVVSDRTLWQQIFH